MRRCGTRDFVVRKQSKSESERKNNSLGGRWGEMKQALRRRRKKKQVSQKGKEQNKMKAPRKKKTREPRTPASVNRGKRWGLYGSAEGVRVGA